MNKFAILFILSFFAWIHLISSVRANEIIVVVNKQNKADAKSKEKLDDKLLNNIAIIINKANNTHHLTSSELALIYKGIKEKWRDGQRIAAINRPVNSDIRHQFYNRVLELLPSQKFFKPGSPIPFVTMRVKSDYATQKFVARIPNAIGYIRLGKVDDSVKVLKIDEKFPWEDEYRLKIKD